MAARPDYKTWQQAQLSKLKTLCSRSSGLQDIFNEARIGEARDVCPDVNPAAIACLSRSNFWPDEELEWVPVVGVPIIGTILPSGIYRQADIQASIGDIDWRSTAAEWNAGLITRHPPIAAMADAIFAKSVQEQDLRILGPWMTLQDLNIKYGADGWRALPRFAVSQKND